MVIDKHFKQNHNKMDVKKFHPENIKNLTIDELQALTHDQIIALGKEYPNTQFRNPYLVAVPRNKEKEMPVTASWAILASWINVGFKNYKIVGTYENYMAEQSAMQNSQANNQAAPVQKLGDLKVDLGPVNLEDKSNLQGENSEGEEDAKKDDKESGSDSESKTESTETATENKPTPATTNQAAPVQKLATKSAAPKKSSVKK